MSREMISFAPIWAIVLRYLRLLRRDISSLLFSFYWPLLDVLMWGFMGTWMQSSQSNEFHNYQMVALLGILLWGVAARGANVMGMAFMEEIWSGNIVNLFSLPIRTSEWMLGMIFYTLIMTCMVTAFSMFLIYCLYHVSMLSLFSSFIVYVPPLIFSGIWFGFMFLQIVVLQGKRAIELGFIAAWFLLPFSGAYYPISVLPQWAQLVSRCIPMSYVFEGMRGQLMHQQDPTHNLLIGYILSILYAAASIALFVYCFNRSKQRGLARLVD